MRDERRLERDHGPPAPHSFRDIRPNFKQLGIHFSDLGAQRNWKWRIDATPTYAWRKCPSRHRDMIQIAALLAQVRAASQGGDKADASRSLNAPSFCDDSRSGPADQAVYLISS
jgi:hypothetical protein